MKKIVVIVFILLFLLRAEAQKTTSFYPFKGFHVGITAQVEYIQKCSFVPYYTYDMFVPKGRWTIGWEAGMEFSYHFAKYFGISAGFNYGTELSYNCDIYLFYLDDLGLVEEYDKLFSLFDHQFILPLKFEFHYPLRKNLFFMAETGIKIKGIVDRLSGNKYSGFGGGYTISTYISKFDTWFSSRYFRYSGVRDVSKIRCEFLLGMGLYYKMPYGDLLRFTAGVNLSFKNIIDGKYIYYHNSEHSGTFSVKNDFIYTQLSYIHTLNWQKANKYLKKQEYSFSSKKERNKKIIELLDIW